MKLIHHHDKIQTVQRGTGVKTKATVPSAHLTPQQKPQVTVSCLGRDHVFQTDIPYELQPLKRGKTTSNCLCGSGLA